jgi:hypothetical protein
MKYFFKSNDKCAKAIADDGAGNIFKVKIDYDSSGFVESASSQFVSSISDGYQEVTREVFCDLRNSAENQNEVALIGNRPNDR